MFAIWQNDGQFQLIDPKGAVIENVAAQDYAGLPHFIGTDIAEDGSAVLSAISAYPDLANCLLYTSPSPRDQRGARMPSSA